MTSLLDSIEQQKADIDASDKSSQEKQRLKDLLDKQTQSSALGIGQTAPDSSRFSKPESSKSNDSQIIAQAPDKITPQEKVEEVGTSEKETAAPQPATQKAQTQINSVSGYLDKTPGPWKKELDSKLGELKQMMQQANDKYEEGKNKQQWSEVMETIGNAVAQIGAGAYGMKHGVDATSGLKFSKTDWDARNANLLNELKAKQSALLEQGGQAEREAGMQASEQEKRQQMQLENVRLGQERQRLDQQADYQNKMLGHYMSEDNLKRASIDEGARRDTLNTLQKTLKEGTDLLKKGSDQDLRNAATVFGLEPVPGKVSGMTGGMIDTINTAATRKAISDKAIELNNQINRLQTNRPGNVPPTSYAAQVQSSPSGSIRLKSPTGVIKAVDPNTFDVDGALKAGFTKVP
jgi:hypothetical protein